MALTTEGQLRRSLKGVASLVVAALALGVGGCATRGDEGSGELPRAYTLAAALAEAEDAAAGEHQVVALSRAVDAGVVTVEDVREAARRAVTCMVESGIDARVEESTLSHGLVLPGYLASSDGDDHAEARIELCDRNEYFWLSKAYQLQPSSVEAIEQHAEQRAPAIRACLEEHGVPSEDARSASELADLASRAAHELIGVSCLAEAGVDVW
ncbi:hypothetical protein [Cellulomonas sp. GbtcB1]|uniref:hypothetical protein n=1 Tax=Cellulomonas sp. GbtcB1 TaxID=2824746 RepID=UPI001C2F2728|nr:hypothetical protein [Cellulomonas sp. GbtcB1]